MTDVTVLDRKCFFFCFFVFVPHITQDSVTVEFWRKLDMRGVYNVLQLFALGHHVLRSAGTWAPFSQTC